MELNVWFWAFMAGWLIVSCIWGYNTPVEGRLTMGGYSLLLFIILVILGWQVFGSAVKGHG